MNPLDRYSASVNAGFRRMFDSVLYLKMFNVALLEMGFVPWRVAWNEAVPVARWFHKRCDVWVDLQIWPEYPYGRVVGWIYVRAWEWCEDDWRDAEDSFGYGEPLSSKRSLLSTHLNIPWHRIDQLRRISEFVHHRLVMKPTAYLRWPLDLTHDERWKLSLWND